MSTSKQSIACLCHDIELTPYIFIIVLLSVYELSQSNTNTIEASGHKAMFGVDATKLSLYFGDKNNAEPISFDRIQFNFPHWRGKANNRYNR